jgi:hypothetical protein
LKAQFHQCLPNPKQPEEMVTVQICSMWALGFADPDKSVNEMEEPQNLISPYAFDEGSILNPFQLGSKARSSFL